MHHRVVLTGAVKCSEHFPASYKTTLRRARLRKKKPVSMAESPCRKVITVTSLNTARGIPSGAIIRVEDQLFNTQAFQDEIVTPLRRTKESTTFEIIRSSDGSVQTYELNVKPTFTTDDSAEQAIFSAVATHVGMLWKAGRTITITDAKIEMRCDDGQRFVHLNRHLNFNHGCGNQIHGGETCAHYEDGVLFSKSVDEILGMFMNFT